MNATQVVTKCKELMDFWSERNRQMKVWYDILLLTNTLEQEDMESVISSDPRASFNMALHLLTSSIISPRVAIEELDRPEIVDTSYIETYMSDRWKQLARENRRLGRQSWLREVVSLMLATGWYSVFNWAEKDKLIAEVWNPAEVYPRFSRDPEIGMEACAHVYPISAGEANRKVKKSGWSIPNPFKADTTVYNYWIIDDDGDVANAIVMGTHLVRDLTKIASNEQATKRIPIHVSPVGGLPDTGIIKEGSKTWQKHFGESLIAPAASEFDNQNRMLTYIQQLVRDTASPRWFEQSSSQHGILSPEKIFKRGAIFRGGPGDAVAPLPMPAIPVEVRTILFDYGNRIQRVLFPWALFGNIQQQTSGYMMSQIASAAMGVLTPYKEGIIALLSDVNNYWFNELKERKLTTYGFKMPKNIPEHLTFDMAFNIDIPGSLIQRATVARMLDPTFRTSYTTTADLLFPEIKDPLREQGRVNKDEAMMNEVAQMLALIEAYREVARAAKEAGDDKTATLYGKAAEVIYQRFMGQEQLPAGQAPPTTPKEVRTAAPREEMMPGRMSMEEM